MKTIQLEVALVKEIQLAELMFNIGKTTFSTFNTVDWNVGLRLKRCIKIEKWSLSWGSGRTDHEEDHR